MIGDIREFDSTTETWSSYIERFELFVDCNKIETSRKVSTLLTVVGVKTYSLLRNLCTPDKPSSKSYEEIVKIINDHLYPTPSFIAERYKFSKRNQLEHESVSDYIASLKRLSIHCNFGSSLNDYLRDRLVSGIRSEATKQKLLAKESLTYEEAVKVILSVEAAEKDASVLVTGDSTGTSGQLQRMAAPQRRTAGSSSYQQKTSPGCSNAQRQDQQVKCFCCGKPGHISKECHLRGCVCNFCGKPNHIVSVCKSRLSGGKKAYNKSYSKPTQSKNDRKVNKHNFVSDEVEQSNLSSCSEDGLDSLSNLFELSTEQNSTCIATESNNSNLNLLKVDPIKVDVVIEGITVKMELDTGASVSVCNKNFYKKYLNGCELLPTGLSLSSYTSEPIVPIGRVCVSVAYKNVKTKLDLYVIEKGAHPLMGRDWLQTLGVEISFKPKLLELSNSVDTFIVSNVKKTCSRFS